MRLTKYKSVKFIVTGLVIAVAALSILGPGTPTVSAEPVPSCAQPAVLTHPSDGGAAYCACPKNMSLQTGATNTCVTSCPSDTVSGVQHDQVYCNPVIKCSDGTAAEDNNPANCGDDASGVNNATHSGTQCGDNDHNPYAPAIDIGCKGKGNPIVDMAFAIIRFLTLGVGLVVIASIVVAGIQYSASQGDPQATQKAKLRIRSAIIALIIFIFSYAMLNYVVPAGVFNI